MSKILRNRVEKSAVNVQLEVKMNEKVKKLARSEYLPLLILGVAYFAIHLVVPKIADDISTYDAYKNVDFFSPSFLWFMVKDWYFNWSSRIFLDFSMDFFNMAPQFIWVILDVPAILLLIYSIARIFPAKHRTACMWVLVGFFFLYEFINLGGTGFITVTVTYLWPPALGMYSILLTKRLLTGEKVRMWQYILAALGLVYATNQEQMCGIGLVLFTFCFIYQWVKKRPKLYIGIEWLITMANFINFATCPGNAQRAISEEANYYVGYSTISFFNKIRMGIYATGMKLLIGNWLFFMFAILLAVLVIRKQKQLWKRIVGLIPLGIAIVFGPLAPYASRVFWVIDRIPDGGTLYGDPAAIGTVMVGREILMFALILIAAVTVLLSLYWIFGKSTLTWCLMFAVIMGYATRAVMGFSPTIWVSGERTYFWMHVALMFCSYVMFDEILSTAEGKYESLALMAVGTLPVSGVPQSIYYWVMIAGLYLKKSLSFAATYMIVLWIPAVVQYFESFQFIYHL
ncbi:DUF6056 family protein [Diplocloster agilis]|uniref:Uncharacterized protein n=1 Tax=Diplocloster agilis TaxID=2850323 RepID=A0A949K3H5_9FIRM|nr:hypothetical protein [Diplocloster agilis]MBU9735966.1 hypothetical protein [Diplocloster agilis]